MKILIPQKYFAKLLRAVVEFDLIDDGDRILIGLSGGKDSIFLTYALAVLRERLRKKFTLRALTIDPMFTDDLNMQRATRFCESLEIPHEIHRVDIDAAIAGQNGKKACFTCAFLRRGAMNRYALEHGCNKIAYAHHLDDAIETFLMGILYSGQTATFTPKTFLDRTGLTVIRPLVYFRESEIVESREFVGFAPIKSPCPRDGFTMRSEVKKLIENLSQNIPDLVPHLSSAIRKSSLGDLWERSLTRDEMRETYFQYMGEQKQSITISSIK